MSETDLDLDLMTNLYPRHHGLADGDLGRPKLRRWA
jgi:hypothetical protein